MRILFDTHTLIWFLSDSPHLTPQARGLLSREGVEIFGASGISVGRLI